MADEKTQVKAPAESAPAPEGGKSKKKLILFGLIGLVLVGVAVGGGVFLGGKLHSDKGEVSKGEVDETEEALKEDIGKEGGQEKASEGKEEEGGKKEGEEGKGAVSEGGDELRLALAPIATNLNEESIRRVIQVSFVLEAVDEKALEVLRENQYRIRSDIIILLGTKTQAELRLRDGKELLMQEIKARIDKMVGPGKVKEVWYDNFVLI